MTGMPFNQLYYSLKPIIPRRLQLLVRRKVAQGKRALHGDDWPIAREAAGQPENWRGWPDGKEFALVLTHDVDTERGHDRCHLLMELEQDAGFTSSFNFVAGEYRVCRDLRRRMIDSGFEVGVHGLYHNSRLYRSRDEFKRQAALINSSLRDWGAVGFRSPCMYHNLEWLRELEVLYDASTFDTDPFEPQSDGFRTIFPFVVERENGAKPYVELPYTLPQDFTLFVLFKEESIEIWKRKLEWVARNGGMALLNAHPDYMHFGGRPSRYEEYPATRYREFLDHVTECYAGRFWNPLPRELAEFWLGGSVANEAAAAVRVNDSVHGLPARADGTSRAESRPEGTALPVTWDTVESTSGSAGHAPANVYFTNVKVGNIGRRDAVNAINCAVSSGRPAFVCVTNVNNVIGATADVELREATNSSLLSVPDGMPLVWYARLIGCREVERVTGYDLMTALFSENNGYKHFLLGDTADRIERVIARAKELNADVNIVGHSPPFKEFDEADNRLMLERINDESPDIIWVSFGGGKQEKWMFNNVAKLQRGVMIGVGAAFKFLIGDLPIPPKFVQELGLHWLFRIAHDLYLHPRDYRKTLGTLPFRLKFCFHFPAEVMKARERMP